MTLLSHGGLLLLSRKMSFYYDILMVGIQMEKYCLIMICTFLYALKYKYESFRSVNLR